MIPILEMLAEIKYTAEKSPADSGSAAFFLEKGKSLPGGTRIVYAGPDLSDEDYLLLDTLRQYRLSPEYVVIDEKRLSPFVPGGAPRFQMKEGGHDIL
jgi:hypothetical protein